MDEVAIWSHHTELAGDPGSARLAREFVRIHLVEHEFGGVLDDVGLVVSELATNAIVHARTAFSVTLQGDDSSIMLTVRDGSALAPSLVHARATTRGRGLLIVEHLSQRWGTVPHPGAGKSVWAWFDKHPPA